MLQGRPNLDLDRLSLDKNDDVHRTVTKPRAGSTVHDSCTREGGDEGFDDTILLDEIGDYDAAPGDVLDLAQANALALKLGNDRAS